MIHRSTGLRRRLDNPEPFSWLLGILNSPYERTFLNQHVQVRTGTPTSVHTDIPPELRIPDNIGQHDDIRRLSIIMSCFIPFGNAPGNLDI